MFGKIFDAVVDAVSSSNSSSSKGNSGVIDYGNQTIGGGHDHRYNKGEDRTPAQKAADKAKQK